MDVVNLQDLGKQILVIDEDGEFVKTFRAVEEKELLNQAFGYYDPDTFITYDDYLDQSVEKFTGFGNKNVAFLLSKNGEPNMADLIEVAINEHADFVVVEYID